MPTASAVVAFVDLDIPGANSAEEDNDENLSDGGVGITPDTDTGVSLAVQASSLPATGQNAGCLTMSVNSDPAGSMELFEASTNTGFTSRSYNFDDGDFGSSGSFFTLKADSNATSGSATANFTWETNTGSVGSASDSVRLVCGKVQFLTPPMEFCKCCEDYTVELTPDSISDINWSLGGVAPYGGVAPSGRSARIDPSSTTPGSYTITATSNGFTPARSDSLDVEIVVNTLYDIPSHSRSVTGQATKEDIAATCDLDVFKSSISHKSDNLKSAVTSAISGARQKFEDNADRIRNDYSIFSSVTTVDEIMEEAIDEAMDEAEREIVSQIEAAKTACVSAVDGLCQTGANLVNNNLAYDLSVNAKYVYPCGDFRRGEWESPEWAINGEDNVHTRVTVGADNLSLKLEPFGVGLSIDLTMTCTLDFSASLKITNLSENVTGTGGYETGKGPNGTCEYQMSQEIQISRAFEVSGIVYGSGYVCHNHEATYPSTSQKYSATLNATETTCGTPARELPQDE